MGWGSSLGRLGGVASGGAESGGAASGRSESGGVASVGEMSGGMASSLPPVIDMSSVVLGGGALSQAMERAVSIKIMG